MLTSRQNEVHVQGSVMQISLSLSLYQLRQQRRIYSPGSVFTLMGPEGTCRLCAFLLQRVHEPVHTSVDAHGHDGDSPTGTRETTLTPPADVSTRVPHRTHTAQNKCTHSHGGSRTPACPAIQAQGVLPRRDTQACPHTADKSVLSV